MLSTLRRTFNGVEHTNQGVDGLQVRQVRINPDWSASERSQVGFKGWKFAARSVVEKTGVLREKFKNGGFCLNLYAMQRFQCITVLHKCQLWSDQRRQHRVMIDDVMKLFGRLPKLVMKADGLTIAHGEHQPAFVCAAIARARSSVSLAD